MIKNKKSDKANLENKRSTFFLIGLVLALAVVLMAFEWKTSQTNVIDCYGSSDFTPEDYVHVPRTRPDKPELPKPVIEVPDFKIVDNETEVDDFDPFSSEYEEELLIDYNSLTLTPVNKGVDKDEDILIFVEEMPEFPGGQKALLNYLSKKVNYPVIAQENGIHGKVYVSFVVDESGNILDVTVLRGVDVSLDNEALRVVRGMPKWKPGKQGGKAVKVRYNVPISFQLQ